MTIDKNQLVASSNKVGPENFDVKNGTFYFANNNQFQILNYSGNWLVFKINATFPATAYRVPEVKIVDYY